MMAANRAPLHMSRSAVVVVGRHQYADAFALRGDDLFHVFEPRAESPVLVQRAVGRVELELTPAGPVAFVDR